MRTVTYYYAYDDTKFYTAEECEKYERQAWYHINQLIRCCAFFDNDMILMNFPAGLDIEEALDLLNDMVGECTYIEINEKIPSDSFDFLGKTVDYCFPKNEIGLYKYDFMTDKWVSIG